MTRDDVDAFIRNPLKSLDAQPDWRDGNRAGEKRCSIPVSVDGSFSPVSLEMTVRLADLGYLMALLLVSRRVVCRLCTATEHFDRELGQMVEDSHFHSWSANRPGGQTLPKQLRRCVLVPDGIVGRDASFAWFLNQNGIASPPWIPGGWPASGTFL